MATKRVFPPTIVDEITKEHVDAWVDYSVESLNENVEKVIASLDKNSKSTTFLAWVGLVVAITGVIMSAVWAWYTYLSYIK